jgi:hypothetical protein
MSNQIDNRDSINEMWNLIKGQQGGSNYKPPKTTTPPFLRRSRAKSKSNLNILQEMNND